MFFHRIPRLFARRRPRPSGRRSSTTGLMLECLETREVPANLGGLDFNPPAQPLGLSGPIRQLGSGQTLTLDQKVIEFCKAHLNLKVGGGECAHLANEALRVAGASFIAQDPTHTGDYVWGSLVTTITHGHDSNPSLHCQPGDIIQYQDVKLSSGWSATHHTAIVAAVDSSGRPTEVYDQNVTVNGRTYRTERLDTEAINLHTVLAGTIHIYRPVPYVHHAGRLELSILNNTSHNQTVNLYFNGQKVGAVSLTSINTTDSYLTETLNYTGSGSWSIGFPGKTVAVHDGAGYDVYTTTTGQTTIRQL